MSKEQWKKLNSKEEEMAKKRLHMSYEERVQYTRQPLAKELFELMEKKESNLVVAADPPFESANEVFKFAKDLAPDIIGFKFHPRIYQRNLDWFSKHEDELLFDLAKEGEFVIINDTKIDDIGKIALKQALDEMGNAHMVTALTAAGGQTLKAINDAAKQLFNGDGVHRGSIPMLYMTPEGHLFDKIFDDAIDHANTYGAIGGVVAGRSLDALYHVMGRLELGILIFSPGIKIGEKTGERGQTYGHPFHAALHGTDINIVGSGVYRKDNPPKAAKEYRKQGWEGYLARLK